MLIKKKQILTATLILALCAAVAVNWYYSSPTKSSREETTENQQLSGNLGDSLFVAGSVQSQEGTTAAEETAQTSTEAYFAQARLKRTTMHDEAVDEIEDILSADNLSQEEKSKISVLLSQFQADLKKETDAENLISAKTGGECLVIINDGTAQVILQKGTLNDSVLLQITEILEKNAGIFAENLTIIEAK